MGSSLTKEVRNRARVGIVETDITVKSSIHFSEWWNGEGMDFTIEHDNDSLDTKLSLHSEELTVLAAIGLRTGMIDLKDLKKLSKEIIEKDY